ncbi:phage portal protein [Paludibacterium purpuratum]|uniref:SPP1 gp7 family putative phage head morphogenesis protein n=1 Tax=Paludibacterium purpuratum TaxID=1144873 RepID=A0A4R7BBC1_9NEIS|nr:phage portal protein [Paludibacterium purpuratum]TDR82198.1 SPP1 gp7 family putative phage head morphogenesis protein [Paludibacterium purpuratum]
MAEKKPIDPGLVAWATAFPKAAKSARVASAGSSPADEFMGPLNPPQPSVEPSLAASVIGRRFDYDAGYNMRTRPRQGEAVTFDQMRALADNCDILRLVIETRKDQVAKIKFAVKPRSDKQERDARCDDVEAFLQFPDGENTWTDWLRMLLEDMLVIDAATVYPSMTNGGLPYQMQLIDGATIKRVLDARGRTPLLPAPAYQQVIKGVIACDYTSDELIYAPRNKRTHKVYGYSPVEQIILTVNIAIRRAMGQLQYYTHGSMPDLLFGVPDTWQPDQIKTFEEYFNELLSGDTAARRQAKFVPGGIKPIDTKERALKDDYDEWLTRIICYAFSVSPQWATKQMNRATAETAKEQSLEEGLEPIKLWVKSILDRIIWRYFGFHDLEFAWVEEEATDPLVQSQIVDSKVRGARMTINEARAADGMDPVEGGGVLLIFTATGAVTLDSVLNPPPVEPGPEGDPPPGLDKPAEDNATPPPGENPPSEESKKVAKSAKKALRPIDRERKAILALRAKLKRALTDLFTEQADAAVAQATQTMGKIAKGREFPTDELPDFDFSPRSDELVPQVVYILSAAGKDGVKTATLQIDAELDDDALELANERAVQFANDRAAEMVGKKWVDGKLVNNPDARWVIDDTTRDRMNAVVAQAMEEGWSNDELSDAINDDYAFSDARADMIARTETANADIAGNLALYKSSGMVSNKQWLTAPDCCDECQDLNGAVVDIDDDFEGGGPPLHPQCRCDVLPVLDDETDDNSDQ